MRTNERYYGVYSHKLDTWLFDSSGVVIYCPLRCIAQIQANYMKKENLFETADDWEVRVLEDPITYGDLSDAEVIDDA